MTVNNILNPIYKIYQIENNVVNYYPCYNNLDHYNIYEHAKAHVLDIIEDFLIDIDDEDYEGYVKYDVENNGWKLYYDDVLIRTIYIEKN